MYDRDKHQFLKDYEDLPSSLIALTLPYKTSATKDSAKIEHNTTARKSYLQSIRVGKIHLHHWRGNDMAYDRKLKELEQVEQDFAVLGQSMGIKYDDNATDIYHALEVVFDKMSKDEFNTINKVNG